MAPRRYGSDWQRIRLEVLDRDDWVCQLCGEAIDRDARPRSPQSASVDHIVELHRGGDPSDRDNLRAAHLVCNQARNGEPDPVTRYRAPRDW